ncbi:MAG: hypothetical protein AABY07_08320 [Nanoarchaeota archaeon]
MKVKTLLGTLSLALSSCSLSRIDYLEGKVVKESGNIKVLTEPALSNIPFDRYTYVLTVETDEGTYIMDVYEKTEKPLHVLEVAIEVGDRIRFPVKNYLEAKKGKTLHSKDYFSSDRIGSVPSNLITIMEKAKK